MHYWSLEKLNRALADMRSTHWSLAPARARILDRTSNTFTYTFRIISPIQTLRANGLSAAARGTITSGRWLLFLEHDRQILFKAQRLTRMRSIYDAQFPVSPVITPDSASTENDLFQCWSTCSNHSHFNFCDLTPSRQRLELMHELYMSEVESIPNTPQQTVETLLGTDPFYDRFPWFRLVGRAFVYLTNLLHNFSLVHKVAIVNEKGDVKGYLRVGIQSVDKNEEEKIDSVKKVRQSAKLHFRQEYFFKKKCKNDMSNNSLNALSLEDRIIEGYSGDCSDQNDELVTKPVSNTNSLLCSNAYEQIDDFPFEFPPHMREGEEFTFRVTLTVSKAFLYYVHHFPIIFEIFGHYQPPSKDCEYEASTNCYPLFMK
ncbi:unnamed protein product [Soboliphyme baturini]|uniref:KIF1B domain-containing protein n=1 Tax=Soboliphyme baturini TaxID=241478 RepID=A0A183IY00_9BILA|nr:unnamed protein product [Soboliphyme baturini]